MQLQILLTFEGVGKIKYVVLVNMIFLINLLNVHETRFKLIPKLLWGLDHYRMLLGVTISDRKLLAI